MKADPEFITPVFLVGARRSGTTLFRMCLNGHPDVSWDRGWEFAVNFIDDHGRVLKHFDAERPQTSRTSSIEDIRSYLNNKAHTARGKKKILGVTVHVGFEKIPYLYSDAKYIHLIRDPRDIAISSVKLGWSGSYYYAPDIWVAAEQEWEELSAVIDKRAWIELRYEDFVTHPEAELRRVCEFIGIDYTEKLFDYTKTTKYNYPKESLAYRWESQLRKDEVQLIESRVGGYLQKRGYQASQYPVLEIKGLKALELKIRNFAGIKARGIADEGLSLYMIGLLGRKLGLKSLIDLHDVKLRGIKQKHVEKLEKDY
ncbi:sulfotransferase family protein [Thiocapsa marina]|uniref:Sulfotransferase n=1 Tax=Thiocapsa marina 5811 TaxID=768671 RepID=F9UE92_9GAMM|nr:sulfotransferase [Thiocapsa marina]EGV17649.1 sulfotransferase [Thiocapsa marina 5811]